MGYEGSGSELDEQPIHTVIVDDFYLDVYEVSVRQYTDFLNAIGGYRGTCDGEDCTKTLLETGYSYILNNLGVYAPQPGSENFPVNWVSWHGAHAYCEWVGMRLPTEAEWEYAARGNDGRLYPWGNDEPDLNRNAVFGYDLSQTNFGRALKPVDALPDGVSAFGIFNMAGNVREWVQDYYDADIYREAARTSTANEIESDTLVLRGGGWFDSAEDIRATNRFNMDLTLPLVLNSASLEYSGVGFRCAADAN